MKTALLISLGGVCGALLRYAAVLFTQQLLRGSFPYGTLLVNVFGCFAAGAFGARLLTAGTITEGQRLLLQVGFLGSFTTFSSYIFECLQLCHNTRYGLAFVYAMSSNLLGLVFAFLGFLLFRLPITAAFSGSQ
ncbi:MAG: fluoride efflux transporter CrcB [bacterium]|nr:fluoride efflux transporter CrcB [bacterium]